MILFTNNFESKLAGDISADATTLTLISVAGLPDIEAYGDVFYLTLENDDAPPIVEVVKVTSINKSGGTVVVERGQEGTTPSAFLTGTSAANCVTANTLVSVVNERWSRLTAFARVDETTFTSSDYIREGTPLKFYTSTAVTTGVAEAVVGNSISVRGGTVPLGCVAIEKGLDFDVLSDTFTSLRLTSPTVNSSVPLSADSEDLNQFVGRVVGGTAIGDIPTYKQVVDMAFNSALPDQGGHAGYFLLTDGANPSWSTPFPNGIGHGGKFLKSDGTDIGVSWDTALTPADLGETVASLDVNKKIPAEQMPDSVVGGMTYKGTFEPSAGYPVSPQKGYYYICSTPGIVGGTEYAVGDWAAYNGSTWDKIDNTDEPATTTQAGVTRYATLEEAKAHANTTSAVNPEGLSDLYSEVSQAKRETLLTTSVRNLLNGTLQGTEGRRKTLFTGNLTINSNTHPSATVGSYTVLLDSNTSADTFYGSFDKINPEYDYYILDDTNTPLVGFFTSINSVSKVVRAFQVHPKHGNVTSKFTIGKTYPVYVFGESTEPADQMTGVLDVVENFIGIDTLLKWEANRWYNASGVGYKLVQNGGNTNDITYTFTEGEVVSGDVLKIAGTISNLTNVEVYIQASNNGIDWVNSGSFLGANSGNPFSLEVTLPIATYYRLRFLDLSGDAFDIRFTEVSLNGETNMSSPSISVGDYTSLNMGYWNGPNWQSQLLVEAPENNGMIQLKLRRKAKALPSIYFMNSVGSLVEFTSTTFTLAQTTPNSFAYDSNLNTIFVNKANSFAGLGYSSEGDMLAKGKAESRYQTPSRRVRPIDSPINVILGDVFISQAYTDYEGSVLSYELIQNVTTGANNRAGSVPLDIYRIRNSNGELWTSLPPEYDAAKTSFILQNNNTPAYAVLFGLASFGGTYHLILCAKELVHSGVDWGDSGIIPLVDNVITAIDDNGGIVITGTYSYDTGIPAT